ncbi:unnamed protein product [Blepharisma stoltei]|uniref:Rab-GAP TBC domain-containing protein n=1 Tax=Blepharisma stoltei TaxID=1481888 RepID=A0AAU9IYS4_9CILI|nr:unnamed protein product [Blepharisma stoltei]
MGSKCTIPSKKKACSKPKVSNKVHSESTPQIPIYFYTRNEAYSKTAQNFFPLLKKGKENLLKILLIELSPKARWNLWKTVLNCKIDYSKYVQISDSVKDPDLIYVIDKDIERTFPSHPEFSANGKYLISLRQLLLNFIGFNKIDYCQGINFIAGMLLIVSGGNECESYWMLDCIFNKFGVKNLFDVDFSLVNTFADRFYKEAENLFPTVSQHLDNVEFDDMLWLKKWFLTMFTYSFPLSCSIRIWDFLMVFGLGGMVNIALGIISHYQNEILNSDFEGLLEFFSNLITENVDIEKILDTTLKLKIQTLILEEDESENESLLIPEEFENDERIKTAWDTYTLDEVPKDFVKAVADTPTAK